MDEEQEHKERPRPRVIDKRVSARSASPETPVTPAVVPDPSTPAGSVAPAAAPSPATPAGAEVPTKPETKQAAPGQPSNSPTPERSTPKVSPGSSASSAEPAPSSQGEVWTPEQEAEIQRVAQQIVETPSFDWVVNTAVTLANVAGTKLDAGAVADAQLAIDGLAALVNGLGSKLGTAETPLRQTLAQLQMAYAEMVAPPPAAQ